MIGAVWFLWFVALSVFPVMADSSSPLLAAYYDRQMAIVDGMVYGWRGNDKPRRLPLAIDPNHAKQVGVGRQSYYVLMHDGRLLRFRDDPAQKKLLMSGVNRFAAGDSGVLAVTGQGTLWWLKASSNKRRQLATGVSAAAVGDGANYYVLKSGTLFVKGKAHRGQYGDGRLKTTIRFIQTASDVVQITAHTGHAILLKSNGDVLGTGGNIYGPVGRHGLGDKADSWSKIMSGVRAIATGSSHSLAIRRDGTLMAWGSEYGPDPSKIMNGVVAVAAGSHMSIALTGDGHLWQWGRGEAPRHLKRFRSR